MFPEVCLVQFWDETAGHVEGCNQGHPDWKGKNNYAGISLEGKILDFPDFEHFVEAYVSTITQNEYGFPQVLAATNPELQMARLGRSEWAGSHYDADNTGRPGVDLVNIYRADRGFIDIALSGGQGSAPAAATEVLQEGDKGPEVAKLQQELEIPADGEFGPQTKATVEELQTAAGLQVDGVAGPQTEAAASKIKKEQKPIAYREKIVPHFYVTAESPEILIIMDDRGQEYIVSRKAFERDYEPIQ